MAVAAVARDAEAALEATRTEFAQYKSKVGAPTRSEVRCVGFDCCCSGCGCGGGCYCWVVVVLVVVVLVVMMVVVVVVVVVVSSWKQWWGAVRRWGASPGQDRPSRAAGEA